MPSFSPDISHNIGSKKLLNYKCVLHIAQKKVHYLSSNDKFYTMLFDCIKNVRESFLGKLKTPEIHAAHIGGI